MTQRAQVHEARLDLRVLFFEDRLQSRRRGPVPASRIEVDQIQSGHSRVFIVARAHRARLFGGISAAGIRPDKLKMIH